MGEVRFMISEAAKQVKVESHVLRYWEEELEMNIGRTEMGHRYYTKDDIQLFCCIKKLKDEGMLLKDLKPLIPELMKTRLRLQKTTAEVAKTSTPENITSPKRPEVSVKKAKLKAHPVSTIENTTVAPLTVTKTETDIIPATQLEQVRSLIGDVLTEVVTNNNDVLQKEINKTVTQNVIREMDFLFQAKERQEEEHFRKLDCLIRQQQANRKEAAHDTPIRKLKRLLT